MYFENMPKFYVTKPYNQVTMIGTSVTDARLLVEIDPTASADSNGYIGVVARMTTLVRPVTKMPPLTVPDLADSVEAMLARRNSGIPSGSTSGSLMMRSFPTDPSTIKTAGEVLRAIQDSSKKELEATNKQIQLTKIESAKKAKQAQKDAEAFAEFQAQKAQKKSEG